MSVLFIYIDSVKLEQAFKNAEYTIQIHSKIGDVFEIQGYGRTLSMLDQCLKTMNYSKQLNPSIKMILVLDVGK